MPDGRVNKCKECNKKDVRKNYADNIDEKRKYDSYRQRHSFQRIFNHRYMNIKHRCEGKISGGKYKGIYFCQKDEFIEWCYKKKNMDQFISLWETWRDNNFERKYTPSIDRINNDNGYLPENLQWLTQSENSSKNDGKKVVIVERDERGYPKKVKRV
jgi:hypothetical protein